MHVRWAAFEVKLTVTERRNTLAFKALSCGGLFFAMTRLTANKGAFLTNVVRSAVNLTCILWATFVVGACAARADIAEGTVGSADHHGGRSALNVATALDCPLRSNCVNSLGPEGLAPLRYAGASSEGMEALRATLALFPEASVLHTTELSVDAIFTTPMGFVDEVAFRISPQTQRIDFRSRSKIGLYDFNKNRSRMTAFSAQFAAQTRQ